MKVFLKICLAAIIALAPVAATAQDQNRQGRHDPAQREAFSKAQAAEIAKKLELNDDQTAKFTRTYLKCQKEMWSMYKRDQKRVKPSEMTEEQAKTENADRLEMQQKQLDIRKKYYGEYSKFLTQKQIMSMSKIEKTMMERMMQGRHGDKRGERGPRPNASGERN